MDKKQASEMVKCLQEITIKMDNLDFMLAESRELRKDLRALTKVVMDMQPMINKPQAYYLNVKTLADNMLLDRNNRIISDQAYGLRKKHRKEYMNLKNQFKTAFYNEKRAADTALLYKHWFNKDTQFIPQKFISNSRTIDEARRKMEEQIIYLENSCSKYSQLQKELSEKMDGLIDRISAGVIAIKLREIWKDEKETDMFTSLEIWSKKKAFLENLEEYEKNKPKMKEDSKKTTNERRPPMGRGNSGNFRSQSNLYDLQDEDENLTANNVPNTRGRGSSQKSMTSQKAGTSQSTQQSTNQDNSSQLDDFRQMMEKFMNQMDQGRESGDGYRDDGRVQNQNYRGRNYRGRGGGRGRGRGIPRGRGRGNQGFLGYRNLPPWGRW